MNQKLRTVIFYKDYFGEFFGKQHFQDILLLWQWPISDSSKWIPKENAENAKGEIEKALKSKKNFKAKNNIKTLDQFKDEHYGKKGTAKRDELEAGYENFKIGTLIHHARIEKGLTQEEVAAKVGTTKSYIQKLKITRKKQGFQHCKKLLN